MSLNSIEFKVETLSALLRTRLGYYTKDELEFIVSYILDHMGLIYYQAPLRTVLTDARRMELVKLANDPEINSYVFRLGALVSNRKPDAKWELVYIPGLDLLKFVYLG